MHLRTTQLNSRNQLGVLRGGFTLLELMLVMAIIVLIAGFLFAALGRASQSARQTASQRSVEAIAAAVEQFRIEFGFLPPLVHDGQIVSAGNADFQPDDRYAGPIDGPIVNRSGVIPGVAYDFDTVVVWPVGDEFQFFRRRDGTASDAVNPSWNIDTAWDDRRYSRYALAYYLTGAMPRSVDGVDGEGMSRPLPTGWFLGVGYPVGSTRDQYKPSINTDRSGVRVQVGYARPIEAAEHGAVGYSADLDADDVYGLYPAGDVNYLIALVDDFGTAYRYYRWEHGRFDGTRLVTETTLDLNIPPLFLDAEALVELENDDANAALFDLTDGSVEIRSARFAIVGAGADRLFGTEPIEYILDRLNEPDPEGDPGDIARLRNIAMKDNVVAFGK